MGYSMEDRASMTAMVPTATYRLQFRNGMTFARASALVPYLKQLGISHLYASPVFTAVPGSTHGYDIIDPNEIDPTLGGRKGFDGMVDVLKKHDIGLILDIVPNHMAASMENEWWRDVVKFGRESKYARFFDVDWSRPITLPFLSDTFEKVLESGDLTVKLHPETAQPSIEYLGTFYPLNPSSYAGDDICISPDKNRLRQLHEQQPYRLTSWRDASSILSYRRFFEVTGLIGMRVEDEAVFETTHRLILELVENGAVDGLRVDHVDGLSDPSGYLGRLGEKTGPDCYIIIEKILATGEQIPQTWPVSGTTGYEFIETISNVFVPSDKADLMYSSCDEVADHVSDATNELELARLQMIDVNFEGETGTLCDLAQNISIRQSRGFSSETIKDAIRAVLLHFPVYRTYGTDQGFASQDLEILDLVLARARSMPNAPTSDALTFIEQILLTKLGTPPDPDASEFRRRLQQLTGPLMAKAVEDTLFYRRNAILALNEVGGEPLARTFSLHRFHADMQKRLVRQPDGLSGTSTHDTKRGEDARARLYSLLEAPETWKSAVQRWQVTNQEHVRFLPDGPAPEPAVEWMLYQALAGVWPADLQPEDKVGLQGLNERFSGYVEKALREAKLRTNWGQVNKPYEDAVLSYAKNLLSVDNQSFLRDFVATVTPFVRAGLVNSLTQVAIKLTAPGIPDIYQGCESLDFSLVDPDNRRQPDFEALQHALLSGQRIDVSDDQNWKSGLVKQFVTRTLLAIRQHAPGLFKAGQYIPLQITGENRDDYVAFARADNTNVIIIIAPRLVLEKVGRGPFANSSCKKGTCTVRLPEELSNRHYRNIWSGNPVEVDERLDIVCIDGMPLIALWAGSELPQQA